MGDNNLKKGKWSKKKKIIVSISTLLLLILAVVGFGYLYIRSKIYVSSEPIVEKEESVEYEEQQGITNILLIGTDARDLNESARSDSIIIATIDSNSKKIKLSSIMRDTFVEIPEYGEQKINAALALGGPELLMKTIRQNFNLSIDKYIMVNFWGFEAIVDSIGGIDMEVKGYEIDEINKFIGEYDEVKSEPLAEAGMQHLDGQQALAFSRIRKVGNGSYERTERQRRVISFIADKLKNINPVKYLGMLDNMLPYVKTNIEPLSLLNYAYTVFKFDNLNFEQLQIPVNLVTEECLYRDKGWVLLIDKEQNGKMLNDFIYRDTLPDINGIDYASLRKVMDEYKRLNNEYKALYGEQEEVKGTDDIELPLKEEEGADKTEQKETPPAVIPPIEEPTVKDSNEGDEGKDTNKGSKTTSGNENNNVGNNTNKNETTKSSIK